MPHVDIELEDNKQFISNIPRILLQLYMKNIHVCNGVGPQVLSILVTDLPYNFNTQQQSRDIAKNFSNKKYAVLVE